MQDPALTEDRLTKAPWRFGEKGREPWSSSFSFLQNGKIGGYANKNETFWSLQDGELFIFSAGGKLTWKFNISDTTGGPPAMEGVYLLDGGFKGVGFLSQAAAVAAPEEQAAPVSTQAAAGSSRIGSASDAKLAILVVAHSAPRIIDRVAVLFDDDRFRVFVHLDAKKDLAEYQGAMQNPEKVTFIEERIAIYWGGFSMVEAELALLKAALADPEVANVVLISDDAAPLLEPDAIYQSLAAAPDRILATANGWREGWYRAFFYPDSKFSSLRPNTMHEERQVKASDIDMIVRLQALRLKGKKPLKKVYFCRQWWALSRAKVEAVLRYIEIDEHFVESFRFSLFSDETFFPTAFQICFPDAPVLEIPTYADFATVPRHPNPWIYKSVAEIRNAKVSTEHLFIRKIKPEAPEVIDALAAAWRNPEPANEGAASTTLEAIRLIIWDLDETFWRGTLTEGGITYIQDYHDIVIELAKRGIMSSICSKNDLAPVKKLLVEKGLWDYLVFPSVNWDAKGPRLKALVEAVQLRPATVLFIDDNALNRNEALHFLPALQVADETIIPNLLSHTLCKGKDDAGLTRLAQYKLLEARNQDQDVTGDNAAFLRGSNIRVTIEHDLEPHMDRVIELINRTNQLNFTKKRLPENAETAAEQLRHLLNLFDIQAGLVHVEDRYGDYGFVGFYVTRTFESQTTLIHYCFSCRTLGMGVETWLYDRLGKPELKVSGEVLTDLLAPHAKVDWINCGAAGDEAQERLAGKILIRGGCAMGSTAHYLALNADEVVGEFNIVNDGRRVRLDHSVFLRHALQGMSADALAAAAELGYTASDFTSALAEDPAGFDVCIFSFTNDARYALYQHPTLNLRVPFFEFYEDPACNLLRLDLSKSTAFLRDPAMAGVVERLREQRYIYQWPATSKFTDDLAAILSFIPESTTVFFLLDPETYTSEDGKTHVLNHFKAFNQVLRDVAAVRPHVHLLEVLDFVEQPSERLNADHFNRMVYFRVYQKIARILRDNKVSPSRQAGVLVPAE